ncbi:MAG: TolC family protein [Nitrospinae bacterium]|nr:TolC family protein [Nitrospinota bacterium]
MKRIGIMLAVLLPAAAFAADERRLSIDEAARMALQNSKQVRMASLGAAAAHAKADETSGADKPRVAAQAGYTRMSDVGPFQIQPPGSPAPTVISPSLTNWYQAKLSVTYPLFTGNRLEGYAESAAYSALAADKEYEDGRAGMALAARSAYWILYKTQQVKQVIDENVTQVQSHLTDVTNMVNAGIMLRDEQLKAQVQLSNARFAQADAANNVKLAMMQLNNVIGLPLDTNLALTTPLAARDAPLKTLAEYKSSAIENRPDLLAARMKVKSARAGYGASKGGFLPTVSLFGDFLYANPNQRYLPNQERWDSTWAAGVMVSYDVFDWGITRSQVAQADARKSQAELAYEQALDGVELEVNQSYLALLQARERIAIAGGGVEQAEESARITKNRFHNGHATNTEVLDAEIALLQSKLNYTIATADYEIAQARMRKSAGEPDTEEEK